MAFGREVTDFLNAGVATFGAGMRMQTARAQADLTNAQTDRINADLDGENRVRKAALVALGKPGDMGRTIGMAGTPTGGGSGSGIVGPGGMDNGMGGDARLPDAGTQMFARGGLVGNNEGAGFASAMAAMMNAGATALQARAQADHLGAQTDALDADLDGQERVQKAGLQALGKPGDGGRTIQPPRVGGLPVAGADTFAPMPPTMLDAGATPTERARAGVPPVGGRRNSIPASDRQALLDQAVSGTPVPGPVLNALVMQESGWDPDARGSGTDRGLGQVLDSTARSPGYGMRGVDPATLRDPAANLRFTAQYLAARGRAAGLRDGDWNDPGKLALALRAYNGGGDPNYAANVMRYLPSGGRQRQAGLPVASAQAFAEGGLVQPLSREDNDAAWADAERRAVQAPALSSGANGAAWAAEERRATDPANLPADPRELVQPMAAPSGIGATEQEGGPAAATGLPVAPPSNTAVQRDPVAGGLSFMAHHFGLNFGPRDPSQQGLPQQRQEQNGGARAMLSGMGAQDNGAIAQVAQHLDPQRQLSQGQRLQAVLGAVSGAYYLNGQTDKGDRAAASILQNYRQNMVLYGGQALAAAQAGDWNTASKFMQAAYDFVPDGFTAQVSATPSGLQIQRFDMNGRPAGTTNLQGYQAIRNAVGTATDFDKWAHFLLSERQQAEAARHNQADEGLRARSLDIAQQGQDRQQDQFDRTAGIQDQDRAAGAAATTAQAGVQRAQIAHQRALEEAERVNNDPASTEEQRTAAQRAADLARARIGDAEDVYAAARGGMQPGQVGALQGIDSRIEGDRVRGAQQADRADSAAARRQLIEAQAALAQARAAGEPEKVRQAQQRLDILRARGAGRGAGQAQGARTMAERDTVDQALQTAAGKQDAPTLTAQQQDLAREVAQEVAAGTSLGSEAAASVGIGAAAGRMKVHPVESYLMRPGGGRVPLPDDLADRLRQQQQGAGWQREQQRQRGLPTGSTGNAAPSRAMGLPADMGTIPRPFGLPLDVGTTPRERAGLPVASVTTDAWEEAVEGRMRQIMQSPEGRRAGAVGAPAARRQAEQDVTRRLGPRPQSAAERWDNALGDRTAELMASPQGQALGIAGARRRAQQDMTRWFGPRPGG